ncbi:MAG: hypothetical protein QOE65_2457 [Solirubrobacteraceae bacterium]|nr:hypothetical protein [Solirubrobacteraceae bacterium]
MCIVRIQRVYLMTDYSSSSLWTDEPCHVMVPAETLGLSAPMAEALEAWSAELFEFLEHEDDPEWLAAHRPRHEAEGRRLWALVRTELAGRCEVGYATFGPDDRGNHVKRVVWDPAELLEDGCSPSA